MPSARTHDFLTVASASVMAPAALVCSSLPEFGLVNAGVLVGSYLASGLLFSPDLDTHSRPYRRWRMMRWVWIPYQALVPHRSWVSHNILFGPVIRVLYFAGIMSLLALIVLGLLNLLVPVDATGTLLNIAGAISAWVQANPATVGYAVLGFVLGAALHTFADVLVTGIKRRF